MIIIEWLLKKFIKELIYEYGISRKKSCQRIK